MSLKSNYEYIRDWCNHRFLKKSDQVKVDLSNYYTKTEVDSQLSNIDLSEYAKQDDLQDFAQYAAGQYMGITTYQSDEKVIAASLNDLNSRIKTVEDADYASQIEDAAIWENGSGTNSIQVADSLGSSAGNYSTTEGKGCVTGGTYTTNTLAGDTTDTSAGSYAHAEGRYSIASGGIGAHAEGNKTLAAGMASHAEGNLTIALTDCAHTEGKKTIASGQTSHSEGQYSMSAGIAGHAEGDGSVSIGNSAHAEGWQTVAVGTSSHAEGGNGAYINVQPVGDANATSYTASVDLNNYVNRIGLSNLLNALSNSTIRISNTSNVVYRITSASYSNGTLSFNTASTLSATALTGSTTYRIVLSIAYGVSSHSENAGNISYGNASHAEGLNTISYGEQSHSEGQGTNAFGKSSHAEGRETNAGVSPNTDSGLAPLLTPDTTTEGAYSHAEGQYTSAKSNSSHAEGILTNTNGVASHVEGYWSQTNGNYSHAEGHQTIATGESSHTEGNNTIANNANEHAEGQYNVSTQTSSTFGDPGNTISSIGIGTATTRKNAIEVMQNGDVYILGIGGYDGTNASSAQSLQAVISSLSAS